MSNVGHPSANSQAHPADADRRGNPSGSFTSDRRRASNDPSETLYGRRKADTGKKRKSQLFVTLCHWSTVVLIAISLLTGMRIGWGFLDSPLGGPNGVWAAWLHTIAPKDTLFGVNVLTLHILCARLVIVTIGVYLVYMFRSGALRRIRLERQDVRRVAQALRGGGFWHNKAALWSANVLVYWGGFIGLIILIITGVALYQVQWGVFHMLGGYKTIRCCHGLVAYGLLAYVVAHMTLQWFFGTFWSIFKAQFSRAHLAAGGIGIAIVLPLASVLYIWNTFPQTLVVARIPQHVQPPVLDGTPDDPVWTYATPVVIRTVKGINNPHDYIDVSLTSLYDKERIYFRVQWTDADVSTQHLPLVKTSQGWKVLHTDFERGDENVYYEDKLAMYITDVRNRGCQATCHLGAGPIGTRKGKHYTAGEAADLWQWHAVSTDPMGGMGQPGYMDDRYLGPPVPRPAHPHTSSAASSHPDPETGGGYRPNFIKLAPHKSLADTFVRPLQLPAVRETNTPTTDTSLAEVAQVWWIHDMQGTPYAENADTYPVGTLLPSLLIAPFRMDRADVRAKAAWHNGQWTLEISRLLNTQSQYDVAFTPEKPVYISVAPFNRTQIRHAEHHKPVRVVLQQ